MACQDCHTSEVRALAGRASTLQVDPDPHSGRTTCTDCHDVSVPRQSDERYATRCADCHTAHYRTLYWNWKATLQQQSEQVNRQIDQAPQSDEQRVSRRQGLEEARRMGFHHLHLSQQLLTQLQSELESATR